MQIKGPAAEALRASHISIGDHVSICLEGARWADAVDRGVVTIPGRAVDGELVFEHKISLKVGPRRTRS